MPVSAEYSLQFLSVPSNSPTTRHPRRERRFSRCTSPMLPNPRIANASFVHTILAVVSQSRYSAALLEVPLTALLGPHRCPE